MTYRSTVTFSALAATCALGSCADLAGVAGPDEVRTSTSAEARSVSETPPAGTASASRFDCLSLDERRVRFTDPGFVEANRVGLYFLYSEVPVGEATLEVVWDEATAPETFERLALADNVVRRNGAATVDYRGLFEHVYPDVRAPVEKRVRVRLQLQGFSDDCSTVRRVTVSPPSATASTTTATGSTTTTAPGPTPAPSTTTVTTSTTTTTTIPVPATSITCRTTSGALGSNTSPGFPVFIPPGRTVPSRVEFTITPTPPPGSSLTLQTFDGVADRGSGVINDIGHVAFFDFALRSGFVPVCGVRGSFDGASCIVYWNCNP